MRRRNFIRRLKKKVIEKLSDLPVYFNVFQDDELVFTEGRIRNVDRVRGVYVAYGKNLECDHLFYDSGNLFVFLRLESYRFLPVSLVFFRLSLGKVFGSITPSGFYDSEGNYVEVSDGEWNLVYRTFYYLKVFDPGKREYFEKLREEFSYYSFFSSLSYDEYRALGLVLERRRELEESLEEGAEEFANAVYSLVLQ